METVINKFITIIDSMQKFRGNNRNRKRLMSLRKHGAMMAQMKEAQSLHVEIKEEEDETSQNFEVKFLLKNVEHCSHSFNISQNTVDTPPEIDERVQLQQDFNVAMEYVCQNLQWNGLYDYLTSKQGGWMAEEAANTATNRNAQFLIWTYRKIEGGTLPADIILKWLRKLVLERYNQVYERYAEDFLEMEFRLSPATIQNYLSDLEKSCVWVLSFLPFRTMGLSTAEYTLATQEAGQVDSVSRVIAALKRIYGKARKRARKAFGKKTMADEVKLRRMPAGGLNELKEFLGRIGGEFLARYGHVDANHVTEAAFITCQMLTIANWYAHIAQGRPSGIVDIRTCQVQQLFADGVATSDRFKTVDKYGVQPIANVKEAVPFLQKVCEWRIRAVLNNFGVEISDHLLLAWSGKKALKDDNLSTKFTAFFRGTNLHLTITALRTLHETRAAEMERKGIITPGQRAAITSINGHTSEVAREYYLRENQIDNVHQAREAERSIAEYEHEQRQLVEAGHSPIAFLPSSDLSIAVSSAHSRPMSPIETRAASIPVVAEDLQRQTRSTSLQSTSRIAFEPTWATRDHFSPLGWGTLHPDLNRMTASGRPAMRARWTDEEVEWINGWVRQHCTVFTKNRVSLCLKDIQRDPAAIAIFHPNHTLDTCRLKEGFDKLRALEEA
jgi:hypothetical protein